MIRFARFFSKKLFNQDHKCEETRFRSYENATSKMMTTKIIPWHRNTRALISWFAGSHRQVNIVKPLLTMNSCSTWYRCADQEEGNIGSWHWKTANVANLKLSTKHINSSPSLLKPFEIHCASLQRIVESQQQQDGTRIVVCGPRQEESSQLKGRGNPYKREFKIIYRRENCHVPPRTWSRSRLSCLAVPAMFETRRIQISCNTNDSWSASKNNHHWMRTLLDLSTQLCRSFPRSRRIHEACLRSDLESSLSEH